VAEITGIGVGKMDNDGNDDVDVGGGGIAGSAGGGNGIDKVKDAIADMYC
jgi:hypothetical protein